MSDRFYIFRRPPLGPADILPSLPDEFVCQHWRTSLFSPRPAGLTQRQWFVWWALDCLGIFRSGVYRAVVIRTQSGQAAFWAALFPKWWRRPFMEVGSVEIGNINVANSFRRRGLGRAGVLLLLAQTPPDVKCIYYLCRIGNAASIALAKSCGFTLLGEASRNSRGLLGRYTLTTPPTE